MKLVVGLGNPGNRYNFTRHNLGFLGLDFYFKIRGLKWSEKPKNGAIFGRDGETIFIKPQDFYNESGSAVLKYKQFYKIDLTDILVICDDFNLEFGKIRTRKKGTNGGNNGLKSIENTLGTEEFARIRVGTGNNELRAKIGDVDFVLAKFTPEEKALLPGVLGELAEKIDVFVG